MGELFKWPSVPDLPKKEVHEDVRQMIYFEFVDGQKRAEAMNVINELREKNPDVFVGLQSVKIDPNHEREYQGLEFSFSVLMDGRDQKILDLLHEKGIALNTKNGVEEKPYVSYPETDREAA